ncbi:MAG: TrmH family RNA methyltransferase [Candidatus Shapirobacteria bacterium]|jgi:tRNA G18 (ribose-2'-O)-methylase SpoU
MPTKLNSHQLRKSRVGESKKNQSLIKRNPIVLVLDNVLDTYNIGSFFRLADAIGAQKLCLCGPVVTPPNIKIHRSSIGTWKWVPWQHYTSTRECLEELKKNGYQIIVCEQHPKSVNYQQANYKFPVAIIAGSESTGVSKEAITAADMIVEIPMYGINISLNVLVATSVVCFHSLSVLK